MTKKIGLLLLSLFMIFGFGVSFANPIDPWGGGGGLHRGWEEVTLYELEKPGLDLKLSEFPFFWIIAVLIETLILFLIAKLFWKDDKISNRKLVLFGIVPTTITLPLLWFVLPLILGNGTGYIIIGELLVTIIEMIIIKYGLKISRKKAIIASIICNLFSFVVGAFIYSL